MDENLWVALAFVLFFALLAYLGIHKKLLGALDDRSDKIRAQLEDARKLREDAQAALAAAERKHRDAVTEAEGIVADARRQAEAIKAAAAKSLEETLARREQSAAAKIAQAESRALSDVRAAAAEAAVAAAAALIADKLDDKSGSRLIDDSIAELPKSLAH
ncbi:MAG: F0F1 ATP synthase subunit B [Pseudomonadota bacterium]